MCIDMHTHTRAYTWIYTHTYAHTSSHTHTNSGTQGDRVIQRYREKVKKENEIHPSVRTHTHIYTYHGLSFYISFTFSQSLFQSLVCVCSSYFLTLSLSFSSVSMLFRSTAHTHTFIQPRKAESVPVEIFTIEKNIDTYAFFSHSFLPFSPLACL